ncbi:MAG: restriction endonuclease subunit S, partial [Propionibacteriaceae bacterium]|nr:restriction endonuclease subunit S [Propionibacteriaceae bacterium]
MSEWAEAPLGDLADVVDCEHKTAPEAPIGQEYAYSVGTPDLIDGRINYATAKRVTHDTFESWSRRAVLRGGDLVLAREAPVGQVAQVNPQMPTCLGQRTVLVRVKTAQINNGFLHGYLLGRDAQQWMADRSAGSTVAHLNVADVREVPVRFPPLPEQRRIAAVLGSLDDLIETDRTQVAILEDLARSVAATSRGAVPLSVIAAAMESSQTRPAGPVEHYSLPAFDAGAMPELVDGETIQSSKLPLDRPCVLVSRLNPHWERCWMVYPGPNA